MKKKKYLFIILFYGIIWGLFEFILGGYFDYIDYPFNNPILRVIGAIILAICFIKYRSPLCLFAIGILAASFKIFNIFTCNIPLLSKGIMGPMLGILQQTVIATVAGFLFLKTHSLILKKDEKNKI